MQLGSLPRLVKLLSSPEKVVRSYAVLCLASMVGNGQQPYLFSDSTSTLFWCTGAVRRTLYKLPDCVASLLTLLAPEEELISQERASFSLSQMACESTVFGGVERCNCIMLCHLLQWSTAIRYSLKSIQLIHLLSSCCSLLILMYR